MKVLHVNAEIGFAGGAEKNLYDVAIGLAERGHESHILYESENQNGLDDFKQPFGQLIHAPPEQDALNKTVTRLLQKLKPDVLYAHRLDALERYAPLIGSVPSVRMLHDVAPFCLRRHKYFPISGKVCHRPFGPWCMIPCFGFVERRDGFPPIGVKSYRLHLTRMRLNRMFDRLIVSSEFMSDLLQLNGFDRDTIRVVPLALQSIPEPPEPVDAASNRLLFVGTQIRSKGVDLFLQMLSRLRADFTAVVVGDGRQIEMFRQMSQQMGLSDRVTFTGWLPHDQLNEHIRQARVVAVTTRAPESFNQVGPEAMSHARPVVAFAVGGIPEWIDDGQTGYLLPEQDIDGMADRVDALLGDLELCRRLGQAGRKRLESRFRFGPYLDKIEGFLLEVSSHVDKRSSKHDPA